MKILAVAPAFDTASEISFQWYKMAMKQIEKNHEVIKLEKEEATRENFEKYIKDVDIFAFWDHGNKDMLGSQQGRNPPLVDLENDKLLKDKETWTMACLSAKELGPDVVKKGGNLYQGYREVFIFNNVVILKNIFGICANAGLLARLEGKSLKECEDIQKKTFRRSILLTAAIPGVGLSSAILLAWDLLWLRYLIKDNYQ